jgi:hypothetical protein
MAKMAASLVKFPLGQIVSTPNALSQLTQEDILMGIQRHQAGDWAMSALKTGRSMIVRWSKAHGCCRFITPAPA